MTVSNAFVSSPEAQRVTEVLGWIDGGPAAPHSSRRGDVMNPSTGAVIRKVAMADAVDVDRAVESAAGALPGWRATTPLRRARILTRFRELLEIHRHELGALISEEHGKVFLDAVGSGAAGDRSRRVCVRRSASAERGVLGIGRPGGGRLFADAAGRRVRRDHAVQLPRDGAALDVSGRAGVRQYVRAEAVREGSRRHPSAWRSS